MTTAPVEIFIAAFPTPDGASKVMDGLKQAKRDWLIGIVDMAVVVKDANGKLKITNSKHRSTRGFVTGGVIGGLIGLLAGPVGAVAAAGGALGALAGQIRGLPMKTELKDLGQSLVPNSSAIVAIIEHTWVSDLEAEMAAQGAQVVHDTLKADIAAQLNKGGNVMYSVGASGAGAAAVRTADSQNKSSAGAVVATGDGVYVENATLTTEPLPAAEAATPAAATEKK
jgi:uncharacterized membrane protein